MPPRPDFLPDPPPPFRTALGLALLAGLLGGLVGALIAALSLLAGYDPGPG